MFIWIVILCVVKCNCLKNFSRGIPYDLDYTIKIQILYLKWILEYQTIHSITRSTIIKKHTVDFNHHKYFSFEFVLIKINQHRDNINIIRLSKICKLYLEGNSSYKKYSNQFQLSYKRQNIIIIYMKTYVQIYTTYHNLEFFIFSIF